MSTDNQQNGVQDGFFAQLATILNKNTIGGLSEEGSNLGNSLNLMFNNLLELTHYHYKMKYDGQERKPN